MIQTILNNMVHLNKKRILISFAILFSIFAADQITKSIFEKNFMIPCNPPDAEKYCGEKEMTIFSLGEPATHMHPTNFFFSAGFTYVRNTGAAWSLFADLPQHFRIFFHLITLVAISFIIVFLKRLINGPAVPYYGLVFVLGGALGNFFNRLYLGYVVDSIVMDWSLLGWFYYFPRYNLADSCISCGFTVFLIYSLIKGDKFETKKEL